MPRVGFEPTIPVFEWAKTVHALDGAATVTGTCLYKKKLRGFSPQANYTDQATAACRRS
jgi:hypothetical protein